MKNSNKIFAAVAAVLIAAAGIAAYALKPSDSQDEIIFQLDDAAVNYTETAENFTEFDENEDNDEAESKQHRTRSSSDNNKTTRTTKQKSTRQSRTRATRSTRSTRETKADNAEINNSEQTPIGTEAAVTLPLELNTATADELKQIDGIGEVLAERIIAKRDELGGFRNRNELLEVDGIGEAKLANIWDSVYIEGEVFDETDDNINTENIDENQADNYNNYNNIETEYFEDETDDNINNNINIDENLQVDLNKAKFADFMKIPDMTEDIAFAILDLRNKIGKFSNAYELLYAKGMTKKFFSEHEKYFVIDK